MPIPLTYAISPTLVEMGRRLFFDSGLSRDGTISCATCHKPERFFSDGLAKATGIEYKVAMRNTPSLLNVGFRGALFWDGYVASLESQAKYPMIHIAEMDSGLVDYVEAYVRRQPAYVRAFREITHRRAITFEDIAQALSTYERTLVSGDSAFDRYYYGSDKGALSAVAERGLNIFQGKGHCAQCHVIGTRSALFMDQDFHITGVGYDAARDRFSDVGAGINAYEGRGGVFLTPSLRNVAETAPYMHDGSLKTLNDVVSYYNRGGNKYRYLDPKIQPLGLTPDEQNELVEFLRALTGSQRYSSTGQLIKPASATAGANSPADTRTHSMVRTGLSRTK
jgi:cytochrome c peroxidase